MGWGKALTKPEEAISDIADKVVKSVKPKYIDFWKDGGSLSASFSVSNTNRGKNTLGLASNDNEFNRMLKKQIIKEVKSNRYDSMQSEVENYKNQNNWFSQYNKFDVAVGKDVIEIQKMWETRTVKKPDKWGNKVQWDEHRLLVKIKDDDKIYAVTNWVHDN